MTIAVHISFPDANNDQLNNFNFRCFTVLANKYPEHHFIFVFDKAFDKALISPKNITAILLSPHIKNRLLAHYWYNYKITGLLNKFNVDIFVSNGINCSLRSAKKQCMIVQDISFLKKENLYARNELRYLKKYFKKFMSKANCIIAAGGHEANKLTVLFPQAKDKIYISGYGMNEPVLKPGYDEMQNIKEKHTEGKEYFLCYITDAAASNTLMLLKAFSAFKKRQLSNMQLVLALAKTQDDIPVKDFSTYKYRNEVKIITVEDERYLAAINSAAYAAIYLPSMEITEEQCLWAISNNVPLLTLDTDFCKGIFGNAALYAAADERSISQNMMLLYKDENIRNEYIAAGRALASAYSWENTAGNLWQALQAASV